MCICGIWEFVRNVSFVDFFRFREFNCGGFSILCFKEFFCSLFKFENYGFFVIRMGNIKFIMGIYMKCLLDS